jgi:hypothetical protein
MKAMEDVVQFIEAQNRKHHSPLGYLIGQA